MRINLFNAKNPNGIRVPVTVNIIHQDDVSSNDGELLFMLLFAAGVRSNTGGTVRDHVVRDVSQSSILEEINKGLAHIGSQINWGAIEADVYPPLIKTISPYNGEQAVSIFSNISVTLRDEFPLSLVDQSTIRLYANNIDVTSEIQLKERSNEINLVWTPKRTLE